MRDWRAAGSIRFSCNATAKARPVLAKQLRRDTVYLLDSALLIFYKKLVIQPKTDFLCVPSG
jgi:hypothetical protein